MVALVRGTERIVAPPKDMVLRSEDHLVIEGRLDELLQAEAFARLGL